METAIFAVAILGSIGAATWYLRNLVIGEIRIAIELSRHESNAVKDEVGEIRNILTEASKRNAQRSASPESTFDRANDKIPASLRYSPIARRRAAAEAASAGPASHKAEVTANNARVMETL